MATTLSMNVYHPISGAPFQYHKRSGAFASNYFLKFYEAGTTTLLRVAMNRTGLDENSQELTYDKIQLDTAGYPINPSGGTGVIHSKAGYKMAMYKNATDANSDNISQADWVIDFCYPGLLGLDAQNAAVYANNVMYTADPLAEDQTVEKKLQEWISVKDFGAVGDGTTDDSVAISTALQSSNNILWPNGQYLCNGVIIQNMYQSIWFHSNVTLKANGNNVILFRQITSKSKHVGGFRVNSNGKTNIIGMQVGPSDPTNTANLVQQIDNTMPEIVGDANTTELVTVQCGPDVSGADSQCRGNIFPHIVGNGSRRAVWLRSAPNASGTVPKCNDFLHVVANDCNSGIYIDAGIGNTFHNVDLTDITIGTAPLATPTGFHVADTCAVTGSQNINNNVLGGQAQYCTRNIFMGNEYNKWLPEFILPFLLNFKEYRTPKTSNVRYLYEGGVNASGNPIFTPSGFLAPSKVSTGRYRVNHSLGTNAYHISITPINTGNICFTGVSDFNTSYCIVDFKVHNSPDYADTAFTYEISRAWT